MIRFSHLKEALAWTLFLDRTTRHYLSSVKTESVLKSFLSKHSIDESNLGLFKAIVPALKSLIDYINKIDSETNILEILFDSECSAIRQFRNLSNFTQTMKNFSTADMFIRFRLGTDKCLALRFNENWNSPRLDVPVVPGTDLNQAVFEDLIWSYKKFCANALSEELETEHDNMIISDQFIQDNLHKIDQTKFEYEFNQEQLTALFESYYGFNPKQSNNNGLYVLILELHEDEFGGSGVPVHEVDNVEMTLSKLGIRKDNPRIKFDYEVSKFSNGRFELVIKLNGRKLFKRTLLVDFKQVSVA